MKAEQGDDWQGDEQPDSVALVSDEAVIRAGSLGRGPSDGDRIHDLEELVAAQQSAIESLRLERDRAVYSMTGHATGCTPIACAPACRMPKRAFDLANFQAGPLAPKDPAVIAKRLMEMRDTEPSESDF